MPVYKVSQLLGSGITGKVFLANKEDGTLVAVKSMIKKHIPEVSAQEVEMMKKYTAHSNVVSLLEVLDEPELLHLVLQYIGKDNLLTWVNRVGCFTETEARKLFRGIIGGVQHVHSFRIVHRDLKCENILLTEEMKPVICDFGFATVWKADGLLKDFCGSFHYAAPEILQRKPYVGPEVDVWSLGVVLYAIITKRMPWDGNQDEMFHYITSGDYWDMDTFSPEIRVVFDNIFRPLAIIRWTLEDLVNSEWYRGVALKDLASGSQGSNFLSASGRYSGRSLFSSSRSSEPEKISRSGKFRIKETEAQPSSQEAGTSWKDVELESIPEVTIDDREKESESEGLSPKKNPEPLAQIDPTPNEGKEEPLMVLDRLLNKMEEKEVRKIEKAFDRPSDDVTSEYEMLRGKTVVDLRKYSENQESDTKKSNRFFKSKHFLVNIYTRMTGKNTPTNSQSPRDGLTTSIAGAALSSPGKGATQEKPVLQRYVTS